MFRRVVNRHRHKLPSDILAELLYESRELVANTEALTAAVAANTTAVNAAVTDITDQDTQAAVDAATTQVEANTTALDNAVTPPAPVPPVEG